MSMQCDSCGRKPILQLQRGVDAPTFIYVCVCGERGINGPTRESAVYGWKRRRQVREARRYLTGVALFQGAARTGAREFTSKDHFAGVPDTGVAV
jgi:hypothetical protein